MVHFCNIFPEMGAPTAVNYIKLLSVTPHNTLSNNPF